jgi:hypothetical protein
MPTPQGDERPIVVVKVNDNGTPEFTDDTLLSGATFELRLDDGDGVYEPDTDDAPVIDTVVSEFGFAVFDPQPVFGSYWITETAAPIGFDIAEPLLVPYTADNVQENCVVSQNVFICIPDDDLTGGLVAAFVADSPLGGDLPSTDLPLQRPAGNLLPWLALASLALIGGLTVAVARARRPIPAQRTDQTDR